VTGNADYEAHAARILRLVRDAASSSPLAFGHLLGAVDLYTSTALEIVIIGDPGAADTTALLDVVRGRYLPNKVVIVAPDATRSDSIPLLEARTRIDGRATAYVCRNRTCDAPVTDPADLARQLER
jgi:uncharacterized protein YyaL (SSP411 family)